MTLKSQVVFVKDVRPGSPVGYGSTWESDHEVRLVTIPVGYGDGYFRNTSGKAQVIIHGKKYPVVGRVCCDQIIVNIEQDNAIIGDDVILLGEEMGETINYNDLAGWAGVIPYEISININSRVSPNLRQKP